MAMEHLDAPSILSDDNSKPLITDFAAFELWFRKNWNVKNWQYLDWRKTRNPKYVFTIVWGADLGWQVGEISGYISEEGTAFSLQDGSTIFLFEFIKKIALEYPDQVDKIIFFNEYGEFSRYKHGISDEELWSRITMERGHVDRELMTKFGFWNDSYE
ncbi:hypothetical protein N5853_07220 [Bartonella sp. HY329]|uniref:hypothetical protein n=1 Tax=unclassified Bartonella TaxID=2645622 RepID=UPI0021C8327D|nr:MULTISPECIES: hypothetical protein [unclassified Bartonella]UXM93922.1 hypothetical protein N5853_07220 [Bartonella sp. HY329]UXN08243.1 hypothetical protein N5852_07230 [Bartonella sp. HY328]